MRIFQFFGGRFLDQLFDHFWATWGAILGSILGPDRPKKGPRWAQDSHSELQRPQNLHLQKPSKTSGFFNVFGVQGLLRQLQKAQEGFQEAPKEPQNLKKMDPIMYTKIINFRTTVGLIFGAILGPEIIPKDDQNWVPEMNQN